MKPQPLVVLPFRSRRMPRLALPAIAGHRKAAQISVSPRFESVQIFARRRWAELQSFEPRILVGYGLELSRFAELLASGEFQLPTVDHAVFALTDCGSNPIGDDLRAKVWQHFGVPAYELIIAPGCRLLAAECEAHDGWHLADDTSAHFSRGELVYDVPSMQGLHTGFAGLIETRACACGRPTARLKNLSPYSLRSSEPLPAIA